MNSREDSSAGQMIVTPLGEALVLPFGEGSGLSDLNGEYTMDAPTKSDPIRFTRVADLSAPWDLQDPVALRGSLEVFDSSAEIISFAASNRWNGELLFSHIDEWKALILHHGEVIGIRSSAIADRLGEVLLRSGRLSRADLITHLQLSRERQTPLGNLLVESGVLSQAALLVAIKMQVQQVVTSLLEWHKGLFVLTKKRGAPQSSSASYNTQSLIMEGLRRIDEADHFVEGLGGLATMFCRQDRGDTLSAVGPVGETLLQLATEPVSVAEAIASTGATRVDAVEALSDLNDAGLIRLITEGRQSTVDSKGDQRLVLLVSGFNGILMRLAELSQHSQRGEPPADTFATFLRFYGFGHIFNGSVQMPSGQLETKAIFGNLDRLAAADRVDALREALNELLNFQLFANRRHLKREHSLELQQRRRNLEEQLNQLRDAAH